MGMDRLDRVIHRVPTGRMSWKTLHTLAVWSSLDEGVKYRFPVQGVNFHVVELGVPLAHF